MVKCAEKEEGMSLAWRGNAFEGCGLHLHFENGDGDLAGRIKNI
jgi:hypothetical protein